MIYQNAPFIVSDQGFFPDYCVETFSRVVCKKVTAKPDSAVIPATDPLADTEASPTVTLLGIIVISHSAAGYLSKCIHLQAVPHKPRSHENGFRTLHRFRDCN